MKKYKTVCIVTLGCRVNMYESCALAERLSERGYTVKKDGICDYYIVNTCAVTAESERKSRQLVRRCASKGKVLVVGCASQIASEFAKIDNVIYVGGNRNKTAVIDVICGDAEKEINSVSTMDGAPYEDMYLCGNDYLFSECRAFIKIQDGCNGKCTYCIIPKCRGRVRSRSYEEVLEEAERLVKSGYNEIILTGIEVGAYNKVPLHELLYAISQIDGVKRLRLGSLSPNVISETFLESVSKNKAFMPHIHLSLQSCNDKILQAMMRPYRKKDIFERVKAIRKFIPNCMISADIIVGFPGETEEDFLETAEALNELEVFHVHSFPYSERKGTPAATMPNSVPKNVRAERNARLITYCSETKKHILDSKIGEVLTVLVEKIEDGKAIGHTNEFLEASFDARESNVGNIRDIRIVSHNGAILYGEAVK